MRGQIRLYYTYEQVVTFVVVVVVVTVVVTGHSYWGQGQPVGQPSFLYELPLSIKFKSVVVKMSSIDYRKR